MGLIKFILKLVVWGAGALAAFVAVIVALQKLDVLPKEVNYALGPVSLRVKSDDADEDPIDEDLV